MLSSIFSSIFSVNFLAVVIRMATPILFASIASYIAGITGVGNIAIEAIMTFGALSGIIGAYLFQNAYLGILFGLLVGIIFALIIAFFSMKFGADIMLVGIALNTLADALAMFILYVVSGQKATSAALIAPTLSSFNVPILSDLPVIGPLFQDQYFITYVCWALIIVTFILVYKTPLGMHMRSCGLNDKAAETAGINVKRLQVLSLVLSGIFAALGGMYLSLNYLHIYSNKMVAGQGWMGVAANGVSNGNFLTLLLSSLIFAIFRAMSSVFSTNPAFPVDLVGAIPYIAVLVFIVIMSFLSYQKIRKGQRGDK